MSRLLSKIKAPNDVKKLAANELPELCEDFSYLGSYSEVI